MKDILHQVPAEDLELFYEQIEEALTEEAYIRACELDSPNSPDFEYLESRIFEKLVDEAMIKHFIGTLPESHRGT